VCVFVSENSNASVMLNYLPSCVYLFILIEKSMTKLKIVLEMLCCNQLCAEPIFHLHSLVFL